MQATTFTLLTGDVRAMLATLPAESVQCVVTSPPYWGLRDYGVEGQIGLEASPSEFVETMAEVFAAVRRVLRPDGTLWLNMGDAYSGSGRGGYAGGSSTLQGSTAGPDNSRLAREKQHSSNPSSFRRDRADVGGFRHKDAGLKPKDLIGMPWRVAFALQEAGWWLRRDIVWSKPNPMPESVTDRPTTAHEYIFLMAKAERYFYDAAAIAETMAADSAPRLERAHSGYAPPGQEAHRGSAAGPRPNKRAKGNARTFRGGGAYTGNRSFDNSAEVERESTGNVPNESGTRNKRSVWTIATQPFSGARFLDDAADGSGRRRSVDCPVHGDQRSAVSTDQDDEPPDASCLARNRDIDDRRDQEQKGERVPIPTLRAEGFSRGSLDSQDRACSPTATASNRQSRKTVREFSISQREMYDETAQFRTAGSEPSDDLTAIYDRNRESNSVEDASLDASRSDLSGQKSGRNSGKCSCTIIDHFATFPEEIPRTCILAGTREGDTVLDPFSGAGTTGVAALGLGRNYIGIELNPEYVAMSRRRLEGVAPMFAKEAVS